MNLLKSTLLAALAMGAWSSAWADKVTAEAPTKASDGYYLVSKPAHLQWLAEQVLANGTNVTYNVRQTADIDCTGLTIDPIGGTIVDVVSSNGTVTKANRNYKGTYDGQGKAIRFRHDASDKNYVGLFGWAESSTFKNININGSIVTGKFYVGSIAGRATRCTFTNCHVLNTNVTGKKDVGGVAGWATTYSSFTDCSNSSTKIDLYYVRVNADSFTSETGELGGVVGRLEGSSMTRCWNGNHVYTTSDYGFAIGGLVGYESRNSISTTTALSHCYNLGTVEGPQTVGTANSSGTQSGTCIGGLVGSTWGNSAYTYVNCYNAGAVNGSQKIGYLFGYHYTNNRSNPGSTNYLSLENCLYYQAPCKTGYGSSTSIAIPYGQVGSGVQLGSANRKVVTSLDDFANGTVTKQLGHDYRQALCRTAWPNVSDELPDNFKVASHSKASSTGACKYCGKDGLEECTLSNDKYSINNSRQLLWFADAINHKVISSYANAVLSNDIDCSKIANFSGIGIYDGGVSYCGEFDGAKHEIKNLSISGTSTNGKAFFGNAYHANIHDIVFRQCAVTVTGTNASFTAVAVASAQNGTQIRNLEFWNSEVKGINGVGMVAGTAWDGTVIEGCHVHSYNYVRSAAESGSHLNLGGIVGQATGTIINKCVVEGIVQPIGTKCAYAGGIVGTAQYSDITNCLFGGSLYGSGASSDHGWGGIVGHYNPAKGDVSTQREIRNCVVTGYISGDSHAAYICGEADQPGTYSERLNIVNCYVDKDITTGTNVTTMANMSSSYANGSYNYNIDSATQKADLTDGKVARLLGKPWSQHLCSMKCPMPDDFDVEGHLVSYHYGANNQGLCGVCGKVAPVKPALAGGYYQVGTPSHLLWVSEYVNTYKNTTKVQLTSDINISDKDCNWVPIGDTSSDNSLFYPQSSIFDGCGHKITFTHVANGNGVNNKSYQGLFGRAVSATIRNLVIDAFMFCQTNGGSCRGILAGQLDFCNVTNVTTMGRISGDNMLGGVVGYASASKFNHVVNMASVEGNGANCYRGNFGGIAGNSSNCTYTDCVNAGNVRNAGQGKNTGGIVGASSEDNYNYCVNRGEVWGPSAQHRDESTMNAAHTGGIAGFYKGHGTFEENMNIGTVNGCLRAGHIYGYAEASSNGKPIIRNFYYPNDLVHKYGWGSDDEVAITTYYNNNTYSSCSGIWTEKLENFRNGYVAQFIMPEGSNWRQSLCTDDAPRYGEEDFFGHNVSYHGHADEETGNCPLCGVFAAQAPRTIDNREEAHKVIYEISTPNELVWLAEHVNLSREEPNFYIVRLTNDIEFPISQEVILYAKDPWHSIGGKIYDNVQERAFSYSIFDGQGHSLRGFIGINSPGFFGIATCSEIKNLKLENCWWGNDEENTGILAGVCNTCQLSNITTDSESLVAGPKHVGGIVGKVVDTKLDNCFNHAMVGFGFGEDCEMAGGIAGCAYRSSLTKCQNFGEVFAPYHGKSVGGLVGYFEAMSEDDNILYCSNNGNVWGSNNRDEKTMDGAYTGGLVGLYSGNGHIENCYNSGTVNGTLCLGYIYGYADEDAAKKPTIRNFYNRKHTSYFGYESTTEVGATWTYSFDSYAVAENFRNDMTDEDFASGKVAALLGMPWGQEIGKDTYPVLDATVVLLTESEQPVSIYNVSEDAQNVIDAEDATVLVRKVLNFVENNEGKIVVGDIDTNGQLTVGDVTKLIEHLHEK